MSTAPRPGWYRDPAGSPNFRWWDGQLWSDSISSTVDAPRPGSPRPAIPAHDDAVHSGDPSALRTRGDGKARSPSLLTALLVATCGFAVFAAAGLGVGFYLWRDSSTGLPTAGPASQVAAAPGGKTAPQVPTGQLDESTGLASIGTASMTLPGEPYMLNDDPMSVSGLFDVVFAADADVHPDYDGSHSWSAIVMLTHLSPALTSSPDLSRAGAAAVLQLSRTMFDGYPTTVLRLKSADHSVDGHPGLLFTGQARYAIPALPSRYDSVTALVVRLDDGSIVAAISSVPNDAGSDVRELAEKSVTSLSVR